MNGGERNIIAAHCPGKFSSTRRIATPGIFHRKKHTLLLYLLSSIFVVRTKFYKFGNSSFLNIKSHDTQNRNAQRQHIFQDTNRSPIQTFPRFNHSCPTALPSRCQRGSRAKHTTTCALTGRCDPDSNGHRVSREAGIRYGIDPLRNRSPVERG